MVRQSRGYFDHEITEEHHAITPEGMRYCRQIFTLQRIAVAHCVTLGIVRVQFKQIMAKMGVRRKADLTRLLTLLSRS